MLSKRIADGLTCFRGLIALALIWVGLNRGRDGLTLAAWLQLLAWVTDGLDGPLARRSQLKTTSWLGDHDLQVDMAVAGGLFLFMVAAGLISPLAAGIYLLVWLVIFGKWGGNRSLGMLVQAPIYGRFLWVLLLHDPNTGIYLVVWLFLLIFITWPRFPQQVIPGFLNGLQAVRAGSENPDKPFPQNHPPNKIN